MHNRLMSLKKAVVDANVAELLKDVIKNTTPKRHRYCGETGIRLTGTGNRLTETRTRLTGTGNRLTGIGNRLTGTGSVIQVDNPRVVKTTGCDTFLADLPTCIVKRTTRNIFALPQFNLGNTLKNGKNCGSQAGIRFVEDREFGNEYWKHATRTINEAALNLSVAVLTIFGLLLGFATFSGVSATASPRQETKSEEESDEDSSTMSNFSQESSERMKTNEFSFRNGTAFRDSEFSYVWRPSNPSNPSDLLAAHEAARQEAEKNSNTLSRKKRPPVIAVLQDRKGNAMGNHSIRRHPNQEKFSKKIGSKQRSVLDAADEQERGRGHGNCAEQPLTHNVNVILQRQRRQKLPGEQCMFPCTCFTSLEGILPIE